MKENETKTHDLALVYIMIAVSQNVKAPVRQLRCLAQIWARLKTIFQAVPEAVVNAKWTTLQNVP